MKARIDQKRLRTLWKESGTSQEEIAFEIGGMSRSTFSLLCSDKKEYKHALTDETIRRIAEYFEVDPEYLTGESEYRNEADYLRSLSDKWIETGRVSDLLNELEIAFLTDDKKHMKMYGKNRRDCIEMNTAEYQRFKYYLVDQIRNICENYVEVSLMHDQNSDRVLCSKPNTGHGS